MRTRYGLLKKPHQALTSALVVCSVGLLATTFIYVSAAPAQAADRDGLPTWWEKHFHLDPLKSDGHRDPDFDGLSNRYEFRLRTNPRRKDTDRDGMEDGIEVRFGFNPRRRDANGDKDHDGVRNIDETRDEPIAGSPGVEPAPDLTNVAPAQPGTRGVFVVNCARTERKMLDPIMAPGRPGASHSHDFFGPRAVADDALPSDLLDQPTSCSLDADRSAYWMPTLFNGGRPQEGGVLQAYYFVRPRARPFPRGLAMIAGNPRLSASNPESASWSCQPSSNYGQTSLPRCDTGQYVLSEIRFPSCWNGRDLDSPDHRSHVAYPTQGRCPASYPVELPELVMFRTFTQYEELLYDPMLASGPTGGLHGDFVSGWDEASLARLLDECRARSCGVVG